jgi:hypothetical protein
MGESMKGVAVTRIRGGVPDERFNIDAHPERVLA